MPRSASLLLRAARTHQGENRLTELLAVVLAGHQGFAHRLLLAAGLTADGEVEVSTQVRTGRGKLVDMQVLSFNAEGTLVGRLWSEHKTVSTYSPGQLPGYADDLDLIGGPPRRLITIVDRLSDAPVNRRWKPFTWRRIAVLAWEAGRDAGGGDWREAALGPECPARQRLLLELLNYLEEEHHTVLAPLTHMHVATFAKTSETHAVLNTLVERAADMCRHDLERGVGHAKDDLSHYWQGFKSDGAWAEPLEGWLELTVAESDWWTYDRAGEPAFGAGFTLPADLRDQLRSAALEPWRALLAAQGVTVALWGNHMRVYRTMYLAELIAKGPTIDAQAQALAHWVDASLEIVAAHDPPNITRPLLKKGRVMAPTGADVERAEVDDAPADMPVE